MTTRTEICELRAGLAASRAALLRVIGGVGEQQFKRRPPATPEESQPWCIAEVLTHLLIDEQLWTSRIALALAEDGAEVQASDRQEREAMVHSGRIAPVPQIIHGLLAARRDLEKTLAAADSRADALRASVISPRGVLSFEWMVRKVIDHENEHVAHIEDLRKGMEPSAGSAS